MSTEYIERGAVLKKVVVIPPAGNYGSDQRIVFAGDIESEPAADVKPVVYARWKVDHKSTGDVWYCSKCQSAVSWTTGYCPCCGARMNEERAIAEERERSNA